MTKCRRGLLEIALSLVLASGNCDSEFDESFDVLLGGSGDFFPAPFCDAVVSIFPALIVVKISVIEHYPITEANFLFKVVGVADIWFFTLFIIKPETVAFLGLNPVGYLLIVFGNEEGFSSGVAAFESSVED